MSAWPRYVELGSTAQVGSAHAYRIIAVKRELAYNGLARGVDLSTPRIGHPAARAITTFQTQAGVTVDGVVGPDTAHQLFKQRFTTLQATYSIPQQIVCKGCGLESDYDPGAVGVADPSDHGIMQLNARAHPDITLDEAFDPAFALDYYARTLQRVFLQLEDWDCAIAAWNVGGGGAQAWHDAGKPSTGGPGWWPELFSRATGYVALVKERSC